MGELLEELLLCYKISQYVFFASLQTSKHDRVHVCAYVKSISLLAAEVCHEKLMDACADHIPCKSLKNWSLAFSSEGARSKRTQLNTLCETHLTPGVCQKTVQSGWQFKIFFLTIQQNREDFVEKRNLVVRPTQKFIFLANTISSPEVFEKIDLPINWCERLDRRLAEQWKHFSFFFFQ